MAKQQPEKIFKIGKLSIAVFKNQAAEGYAFRSAQITVAYKKEDKWEYGASFSSTDLAGIHFLMPQVIQYMIDQDAADRAAGAPKRRPAPREHLPRDPYRDLSPDPGDLPF